MPHPCREHDIAFLSQTYADLEAVNRELENERERHKVEIVVADLFDDLLVDFTIRLQ